MKIGDRIFVRGYIDEIRKDTVIVRNDGGYFGTVLSEIITGELPSAQPEQRWIPCSERLPEGNGTYLVTYIYKDDEEGTEEPYAISDIFMLWKGAFATEEPTDKALAWMPLPEPYKEGQE